MSTPILQVDRLRLEIGGRLLCRDLTLQTNAGERVALLGQNGTGKTTLLHTLFNFRKPASGDILLDNRAVTEWSRKDLARQLGMLFQHVNDDMPATVLETALLGRHPHLSSWGWNDPDDVALAQDALAAVDLLPLADRDVSTLSGGERQRLAMAVLLVQNPRLYLLDEPGNHLDIAFQIRTLSLLKQKIAATGSALCMATHDINMASRFCDQVVLLLGDGEHAVGTADDVLTPELLTRAFQCEIDRIRHDGRWLYFPPTAVG